MMVLLGNLLLVKMIALPGLLQGPCQNREMVRARQEKFTYHFVLINNIFFEIHEWRELFPSLWLR